MSSLPATTKATRRDWLGLAVLALPCLLYSMDLTVLNLALPSLSAQLRPSSTELLWIIDIYGFFVAGSLITMGSLGDRIGRRKLLLIGAAAFGAMSLFAAFASSARMLIVARALLGLAGATLAPSTLSLLRNMFHDPAQRSVAVGVWIASYSAGAAVGPLLGGVLLQHFWWGSVFLVPVPVMVLLLVTGPKLLPEFRDPAATRLDPISAVLSLASVMALVYGLKHGAEHGFGLPAASFVAAGLGGGVLFVRRQAVVENPLIELGLFRTRAFNTSLAMYALATFVTLGMFVLIAQYLQAVHGLSPLAAGLWTAPSALAFIVGSQLAPVAARRVRPASVMIGGLALAALGFVLLTGVDRADGLARLVTAFVLVSLGVSQVFTLANDVIIGVAPPERAGAAAAISETGSELGGALGIAILGTIGSAVYRSRMLESAPANVPASVLRTAGDTVGAALAIAEDLPAAFQFELAEAAREAFASSLRLTAFISALIVIGIGALGALSVRRLPVAFGSRAA